MRFFYEFAPDGGVVYEGSDLGVLFLYEAPFEYANFVVVSLVFLRNFEGPAAIVAG